jgi:poly-gamma-glutamate capsule biosynthesis protein CapA/YwtB (metallophosphatase superfamily)
LILYGCGDFIDDYEGISGHQEFRGDLAPMYFVTIDRSTGKLGELRVVPMQMKRFQLQRAIRADTEYLQSVLNRIGQPFGSSFGLAGDGGTLVLERS